MTINPNTKHIIRTDRAGVFFANVKELDGQTAEITNARRLWYWAGACSLSELATLGTTKPLSCQFTVTVPQMIVFNVIELIPCSTTAAAQIEGIPEWKKH